MYSIIILLHERLLTKNMKLRRVRKILVKLGPQSVTMVKKEDGLQ